MIYNKFFNKYIHYTIYIVCSVFFSFAIDLSLPDDGLRHISFAANKDVMLSWGNVYPNSLFTNYDPWFAWHFLLNLLMKFISYADIHIFINIIVFFFLMILIDKTIRRYSLYNFSSLLYIIVFIITMLSSFRYVMVRPDLLSGLYVMLLLLLKDRFRWVFLLTLFYIPFYYLFFIYTGSIGLVYLIQKKIKAFSGVVLASIIGLGFHLLYDYEGYVDTVLNILNDQNLRMGLAIKEGLPIIDIFQGISYFILLPVFLFGSFFIIWKKYDYFKNNSLSLFLLITSILWVNQHRYFHLFLPLILIFIFVQVTNLDKKVLFYNLRKYFVMFKQYFNFSKNKKLFYIIVIPYSILMLSYIFSSQSLNGSIEEGQYFNNKTFHNKTILSNKMDPDMFKAHYYNPSLKLIPSCSIGWFENKNKKMKEIYVKLMSLELSVTEEELFKLIDYTKSDFYLHYMESQQKFDLKKLSSFGIIAQEIDSKKILFKVEKRIDE